jgi:hypothetical protein
MGCCGAQKSNTEYEVTFRDGTTGRYATMGQARIAAGLDETKGAKAPTVKAVPKTVS